MKLSKRFVTDIIILLTKEHIPYSGKLAREKTFTDW